MKRTNKKIAGIKWIFFDLDGTLADTVPALYKVYLDFLSNYKKEGTRKEFAILNGYSLPEIILFLKSKHNLKASKSYLLKSYRKNILNSYKKVRPMNNARIVLQNISRLNYKLMLVTSANRNIALNFISSQGWQKYFHNYVFGNEVKKSKPDPTIYNLAVEKAGVAPKNVAVIEDSPNGILSAKRAGILTIGLIDTNTKSDLLKAGADIIISELKNLLSFFK